jgi:nucleotide-binding universal stress UspA family protein
MFKTIIVPLDGSRRAEAALPVARRIAQHTGATLVLVRIVSFLSEYWPATVTTYPSLAQAVVETDLAEANAYLETIASLDELVGITVRTTAQFGPPAPTILAVAIAYQSDLIVLCSHGTAGMIHWMMGSVAEKIARHAMIPVLVVREAGTHLGEPLMDLAQPLRMLIPLDGSDGAQAALEPGANMLRALAAPGQKSALHLARVCQAPVGDHETPEQLARDGNELEQARGFLRQTARQIREGVLAPSIAEHSLPVTWSLLLDTDIADALLRVAEQGEDTAGAGTFGGCDLIAISTHGRSGFRRWMLGSITERILHATRRPILIVHPPEPTAWKESRLAGEDRALQTAVHQ